MTFTDTEQRIAELIAEKLKDGLTHPGDPERDIPPQPIALPFKASGMPEEYSKLINKTVTMLSEAVVHTIISEGDCEITPRAEAKTLRIAAGDKGSGPNFVPLHCNQCDPQARNPLMLLTVSDPDRWSVDARNLLRDLHRRSPNCPHEVMT